MEGLNLEPEQIRTMLDAEFPSTGSGQVDAVFEVLESNIEGFNLFLNVSSELERDFNGVLKLNKQGADILIDRLGLDVKPVNYRKLLLVENFIIGAVG